MGATQLIEDARGLVKKVTTQRNHSSITLEKRSKPLIFPRALSEEHKNRILNNEIYYSVEDFFTRVEIYYGQQQWMHYAITPQGTDDSEPIEAWVPYNLNKRK